MKFLLVLAVASCALAELPELDNNDQSHPVSLIVGGVEVQPPGKYPFIASMPIIGCAGSLISPNWVLTACHCIDWISSPYDIEPVWLGRHRLLSGGFNVTVTDVICHPTYDWHSNDPIGSDTALLRISPPVTNIRPVPLDSGKGIFSQPGEFNTVVGWGATNEYPGDIPFTLQEVSLPIITNELCGQAMNNTGEGPITENDICAGFGEGGKGTCLGDNGGPMFYQQNGIFVQTGLVSWMDPCAHEDTFDVFSRVSAVLDWIADFVPDVTIL